MLHPAAEISWRPNSHGAPALRMAKGTGDQGVPTPLFMDLPHCSSGSVRLPAVEMGFRRGSPMASLLIRLGHAVGRDGIGLESGLGEFKVRLGRYATRQASV
ncbi:hypothetical protein N7468_000672 [Penicillium chermesinum]|uniref:Uncharacterized protein n=1 Tax=Penicillium chermesinum TaxID=63820 RepID=A0A9W9PKR5_9EURO|nr:uncharacterized protein N7468_000672 [Penicillium chermesinum]KAJ5249221.1 hypothetical protein N7468_000672 [Penicillium chermesinum]